MRTKILLLCILILTLCACASKDSISGAASGDEYFGWYCEGDASSDDQWHCAERLMLNGELVLETQEQEQGHWPESEKASRESMILESKVLEATVPDSISIPLENPTSQASQSELGEPAAEEVTEQSVEQILIAFDISAEGYTVQLGAYLSQWMAEQSANKITTNGVELRVRDLIVNGEYRFVIVYGQYKTRQQALSDAEQLSVLNPQLDYWVRSIKSMRGSY